MPAQHTIRLRNSSATVSGVLGITTTSPLSSAYMGISYSQQMLAIGGAIPYTWTILSGTLPDGLSMSPSGLISGSATSIETDTLVIQVTDSVANSTQGAFQISSLGSLHLNPYPGYAVALVHPTLGSDSPGGVPVAGLTWNGVTTTYNCYQTIPYAVNDFLTTGGRIVGLLQGQFYQPNADIAFPINSGTSDTNRVVLMGDPAAGAGTITIDLGYQVGITFHLSPSGSRDYATIRNIRLTNQLDSFTGSLTPDGGSSPPTSTLTVTVNPFSGPLQVSQNMWCPGINYTGANVAYVKAIIDATHYTVSNTWTIASQQIWTERGAGPIDLQGSAAADTVNGLLVEYCQIDNIYRANGQDNVAGFRQAVPGTTTTVGPVVRYCKFSTIELNAGLTTTVPQNIGGTYTDQTPYQTRIYNCDFNAVQQAAYWKFSALGSGPSQPNGIIFYRNTVHGGYAGIAYEDHIPTPGRGYYKTIVHHNLFYGMGGNCLNTNVTNDTTTQSDDIEFYNNTIAEDVGSADLYVNGYTTIRYYNNISIGAAPKYTTKTLPNNTFTCVNLASQVDNNAYGGMLQWELNHYGSPTTQPPNYWDTYTSFSQWQTRSKGIRAEMPFSPDQSSVTGITGANFNNAAARDYSPLPGSALLTGGYNGGYQGCYNAPSIAGSVQVGPGW